MSSSGFNHHRDDKIAIETTAGTGAVILPQWYSGRLTLDVNYTLPNNDILFESLVLVPSLRNQLNKREQWMDKYLDTFFEKNASWWAHQDAFFSKNVSKYLSIHCSLLFN